MHRVALALLALPALALAQVDIHAYLAAMDADGDGRVSLAEYLDYMSVGFQRMDANRDGVLDATEMPPSPRRRGPMTLQQHRRNLTATFHRQDLDRDGYLDARELSEPPH